MKASQSNKSDTTLDDIAASLGDMMTLMGEEFTAVRQEMTDGFAAVRKEMTDGFTAVRQEMTDGFAEVYANQRETNRRLEQLEDTTETVEADVKALYTLIDELRQEAKTFTTHENRRFADLEAFALQVAEKTGIPYISSTSKPKRRS